MNSRGVSQYSQLAEAQVEQNSFSLDWLKLENPTPPLKSYHYPHPQRDQCSSWKCLQIPPLPKNTPLPSLYQKRIPNIFLGPTSPSVFVAKSYFAIRMFGVHVSQCRY